MMYFEGNLRARKRVDVAGDYLAAIGLERERVGMASNDKGNQKTLAALVGEIMDRMGSLDPSPVLNERTGEKGDRL